MTPEPCTTQGSRRRHLSVNLLVVRWTPGRSGSTLCGQDAQDEERANHRLSQFSDRRVTVANLPPCSKCAKAAEKRGGAA